MGGNVETNPVSLPNVSSKNSSNIAEEIGLRFRHQSSKIPRAVNSNSPKRYENDLVSLGQMSKP